MKMFCDFYIPVNFHIPGNLLCSVNDTSFQSFDKINIYPYNECNLQKSFLFNKYQIRKYERGQIIK